VLARYRYRVYPEPHQEMMLARSFGCARVVFNDSLRVREAAHAAGEKIGDTEVQRRVITLAKTTPEREWLGEVASVVLVQACQDARRAYRNWFDSISGKRKGRKAGHPRFRSRKDRRQSIRLTRNGFSFHGGRQIPNPRHLRARERKLATAQRAMSRKRKGSANWAKARVRVAVQHRKTREARADHLHKTALRLVRDNQAVYVEDLAVSGLARTRMAKSVHDAGWATLVRLMEEKAERYGRQVVKVSRWFPSSQVCCACGVKDGPKPLGIREWTCGSCGTMHDRDVNAARNILLEGRKVAAGQADTLNACGGTVRPGPAPARPGETGTRRSAA
jgi:putative transposase